MSAPTVNGTEKGPTGVQPASSETRSGGCIGSSNLDANQGNLADRTVEDGSPKAKSGDSSSSPSDEPTKTIRKSSTTTTASKFKEKRPEPLKLNPNLNQDIPLDLSVKSAGNVPCGTLSNIFNLGPTSHLATLETPRIQWQDNDTLLAAGKARLFSSSTNASQRARISSLMGDSPPITPDTSLMDNMFTPSGTNLRHTGNMPHSASLVLESPSNLESHRAQIIDRWTLTSKAQINQLKADLVNGPRRSCSTDNLNFVSNNGRQQVAKNDRRPSNRLNVTTDEHTLGPTSGPTTKKNAISPLAIKSLSITQNSTGTQNQFSYTNQQIASNLNDSRRSPTAIVGPNCKSMTPTSLANATANLLKIHLNSPTELSRSPVMSTFDLVNQTHHNQRPPYKSPSFSSFDHELGSVDSHLSATICQQQNIRTASANFSPPSLNSDQNNNSYHRNMIALQQQNLASISSSATLNTPTLISPSLKAGLCFLHSPTLSPMSSVFDLPSPFLMFQQTASNQQSNSGNKQLSPNNAGSSQDSDRFGGSDLAGVSKSCDTLQTNERPGGQSKDGYPNNVSMTSANDLSHLITSVTKRNISDESQASVGDEIDMDIDCDLTTDRSASRSNIKNKAAITRPSTVIPQICISGHLLSNNNRTKGDIEDEGMPCKFSNKSSRSHQEFCAQVRSHGNHPRQESSSAPPEVFQRRARSKVKTIAADSCVDIANKNRVNRYTSEILGSAKDTADRSQYEPISRAQTCTGNQQNRTGRPNSETDELFPFAGQLLNTHAYANGADAPLGARSNSAEPTVYSEQPPKKAVQYSPSGNSHNNATLNCYQSSGQPNNGLTNSNSAQQLHYNSLSDAARLRDVSSLNRTIVAGLYRPQGTTINSNQQLQQQYGITQEFYQQHQTHHTHSTSANELDRISNGASDQKPAAIHVNNHEVDARQNIGPFYQPEVSQHDFMRQNQPVNQQNISSSLSRVDYLLGEYQQNQVGQHRHLAGSAICAGSKPLPLQGSNQRSLGSLSYGNNTDTVQNQDSQDHLRATSTKASEVIEPLHYHHSFLAGDVPSNYDAKVNNMSVSCDHTVDVESQSESRSSSSLDFSGRFLMGESRTNSEASSNMTSKKYHCDQCSKSFTRSDMLTRHKRLHSGDRPFQCRECKQEFSRSDHLSTHMRTHTGEKPYKCKMCSYSACRKDMITRHLKVHSRSPHSSDCM